MSGRPDRATITPAMGRVIGVVRAALEPCLTAPDGAVCVALSGGLDSSVLIHAVASSGLGAVRAVHVNHQLNPDAGEWGRHCERLCAVLGVSLVVREVTVTRTEGESIEAAARRERYRVLAETLRPGELVLTAHHQGDQAETVLINLLRGSGVAGLRGIPRQSAVHGCRVVRPLLDVPRAMLLEYAREAAIRWVEDPANLDPDFDRNFLRHQVLPALSGRWPGAGVTIARTGRLCAEATELIDALAEQDARRVRRHGRIAIAPLRSLSDARQRNVVRFLCRRDIGSVPPEARLREGLQQLLGAAADRSPVLAWRDGEIRRYRAALYLLRSRKIAARVEANRLLPVQPGTRLKLGADLGCLRLVRACGQGLAAGRVGPELAVRFRAGGERLRPVGQGKTRELKKLLQERGVVPWMRDRIPLLYAGDSLVAVAGLWVNADFAASGTEPGLRVRWDNHPDIG